MATSWADFQKQVPSILSDAAKRRNEEAVEEDIRLGISAAKRRQRQALRESGNCSRCHGKGMGQYGHVDSGACFSCGQLPTRGG